MNSHEYWRWPTVEKTTQLSRTTVWRLERDNHFPKRRQLSSNAVGWLRSEVEEWVETRGHARCSSGTK